MKVLRTYMTMPCIVDIADDNADMKDIEAVFDYFQHIDDTFSYFKSTSELSRINSGQLKLTDASAEMQEVFALSEKTKKQTNGFFDIKKADGTYDTSGLVKGLAVYRGAQILKERGYKNYCVEIAGDMEVAGHNAQGTDWVIGIQNPFNKKEIIKRVALSNAGIATSGIYERGAHIYNPKNWNDRIEQIVGLTVIGPNVYEADRYATACYAMGEEGIYFLEDLPGFEGYLVGSNGIAMMTTGFAKYIIP
jgi:thiamine biosynthesis lipoprotein